MTQHAAPAVCSWRRFSMFERSTAMRKFGVSWKLFGQRKEPGQPSAIARMNLFLHGIEDFKIVRGDTLRNPAFFDGDRLADFDCVIANPPFSLEKWGEDLWVKDPYGRNFAGLPPSSEWGTSPGSQIHMVKSMAEISGQSMAVVLLSRCAVPQKAKKGRSVRNCWRWDSDSKLSPGLLPNLFYGTGLAACILVLCKRKPIPRRKEVLIADASRLFRRGRAQNYLEPEHAAEILGWYRSFVDVQDAVRVVSLKEVGSEDWLLNISRYVLPPLREDIPPLPEAIAAFKEALVRCREAEEQLTQVMTEGGWLL